MNQYSLLLVINILFTGERDSNSNIMLQIPLKVSGYSHSPYSLANEN